VTQKQGYAFLNPYYPLYKITSVRLSEAFKLRPFPAQASFAEMPPLGFSLLVQRRLVSARIGIRTRGHALRTLSSSGRYVCALSLNEALGHALVVL
jgi:hypothetical protein